MVTTLTGPPPNVNNTAKKMLNINLMNNNQGSKQIILLDSI